MVIPTPVSVSFAPGHTVAVDTAATAETALPTPTVSRAVALQPDVVPVTVYMVVAVTVVVTELPTVALRPVEGAQVYEVAPDTESVEAPVVPQRKTLEEPSVSAGVAFTVMVRVTEHPVAET